MPQPTVDGLVFSAAPHGDVLHLLVQVACLLLAARALGEMARRLGQRLWGKSWQGSAEAYEAWKKACQGSTL